MIKESIYKEQKEKNEVQSMEAEYHAWLEERYHNHDCHLSPEDSCSVCEAWFNLKK